jgi:hypothetical protein
MMERALVINDATTSNIYAIATEKDGSIRVFGADDAAKEWADWADAKLQGRGKLEDLIKFLDNSFKLEGPKPLTRPVRAQIAQHMAKFGEQAQNEIAMGRTEQPEKKTAFTTFSFMSPVADPGAAISRTTKVSSKAALINYKALAFRHEQSLASLGFEVKRARAVFDPNLAGGNGGWRCPAGTRRGGKITNRFGRNCGWGVVRRLANTITDTGERLEDRLEDRRKRRDAKRNERMARRIGGDAPKINRRRTGIARALERGDADIAPNGQPRRTRRGAPERMDDLADRVDGGYGRRPRAERRAGRSGQRSTRPGGQAGRTGLPERMDRAAREVLEGTFLENRRKRRQRQGRARNREGLPERMDRAAGEVLEGTFLENRRRRRQAVTQQAQERPRVARTNRTNRSERTPARPSRRTRAGEATPKPKPETEPEAETPIPTRDERFSAPLPQGKSPSFNDITDRNEREKRKRKFTERLGREWEEYKRELKQSDDAAIERLISAYDRDIRFHDAAARIELRSMEERIKSAEERDLSKELKRRTEKFLADRKSRKPDRLTFTDNDQVLIRQRVDERKRNLNDIARTNPEALESRLEEINEGLEFNRLRHENTSLSEGQRRVAARTEEANRLIAKHIERLIEQRDARDLQRRNDPSIQPPDPANAKPETPGRFDSVRIRRVDRGSPVSTDDILDDDARAQYEKDIEQEVQKAQKRAQQIASDAGDDQEKLRELASRARRDLSKANTTIVGTDTRGAADLPMPQRISAIADAEIASAETEIYTAALQKAYALNGENRPTPERLAEMGREAQKEVKETLRRRAKNLGKFLTQKYGDQPAPWLAEDRVTRNTLGQLDSDQVRNWIAKIYEHDEILTPSGLVFRTRLDDSTSTFRSGNADIYGEIEVKDPRTGQWYRVGGFHRSLSDYSSKVEHHSMSISGTSAPDYMAAQIRNSGFASMFNGHAITWLKGAGFEKSGVSAATDGPFVWPRLGFRTSIEPDIDGIHDAMRTELDNYRNGTGKIIANDRDAAKIEFLLNQPRRGRRSDVQHTDFILALSNRDDEDQVVKNFFKNVPRSGRSSATWNSGELDYTDRAFPDDPRTIR